MNTSLINDLHTEIRKLHHTRKTMNKADFLAKYEDKIVYYLEVLGKLTRLYGYNNKVDWSKNTCYNLLDLRCMTNSGSDEFKEVTV